MADVDVPTRAPQVLGALIFFLTLSTVVVGLRIYCRACVLRVFGAEDWLTIVAVIANYGYSTLTVLALNVGYGKHFKDIPFDNHKDLLKLGYVTGLTFSLAPCALKLGVLALYYRLAVEPFHRRLIQIICCAVLTYSTIILFMGIFRCHPISKAWDIFNYPDGCPIRLFDIMTIQVVCNVVASVVIFCMPLPVIRDLNIPRRDKRTITVMLLFGAFVVVASGLGLKWIVDFRREGYDPTWDAVPNGFYSIAEFNMTLITTSLFAVRQLIVRAKIALTSSSPPPPLPSLRTPEVPPGFSVGMEVFPRKNTNSESTDQIFDSQNEREGSIV